MAIPQDQLEKFLKTIIDTKNSKKATVFNQKELQDIAQEMGFTDNEWKEYQEEIQNQIKAGESFMKYGNTEDAIIHFEKATKLNPYSLEAHAALANAYRQEFLKTRRKADRIKAISEARVCLDLDSGYTPAYELISELKSDSDFASLMKRPITWLVLAIVVVGVAIAFMIMLQPEKNVASKNSAELINEDSEEGNSKLNDVMDEQDPGIEVLFSQNSNLDFELEFSKLSSYDDSFSYKLHAYIFPKGVTVSLLTLKVEALDEDGDVVFSEEKMPVRERSITYRPGDIIPFGFLKFEKSKTPDIAKVKVSVVDMKSEEAVSEYEKSPELTTTWESGRPANYNLVFRQRNLTKSSSRANSEYHRLTLAAENTGNLSISKLQVNIIWRNQSDEVIISKNAYIATSSSPLIKRGQTRLFNGTYNVPARGEQIKGLEIKVMAVE
jgi:tetratricopeptide (TPR) repeat protein